MLVGITLDGKIVRGVDWTNAKNGDIINFEVPDTFEEEYNKGKQFDIINNKLIRNKNRELLNNKTNQIVNLKKELKETENSVIIAMDYKLDDEPLPNSLQEILIQRKELQFKISQLEEELKEFEQ